jgi:cytochrome b subunit of formate dehydrogenase
VNAARKLWIIIAISFLIHGLSGILKMFYLFLLYTVVFPASWLIDLLANLFNFLFDLAVLFNLLGAIILIYTVIQYPEAVIFSKAHLLRALDVYEKILALEPGKQVENFGMTTLVDYLKDIPPEILTEL